MNALLRYEDRASDADWAEVLATFPPFAGVGKRQLRKLVRNATFAELARGERTLSNGAVNDSLYVVLGGEGKVLLPTPRSTGEQLRSNLVHPDDLAGKLQRQIQQVIDAEPNNTDARAAMTTGETTMAETRLQERPSSG